MNNWFTSRRGALALSLLSFLALLARGLYDARFILGEEFSPMMPGIDGWWILVSTLLVGGNVVALLAAAAGRRGGWVATLVYNLFTGFLLGAASLLVFLSSTLEFVIFSFGMVAGLAAAWSVGLQLRRQSGASTAVA